VSSSRCERLGTAKRVLAGRDGDLCAAMDSPAFRADMARALGREWAQLLDRVDEARRAAEQGDSNAAAEILRQLTERTEADSGDQR